MGATNIKRYPYRVTLGAEWRHYARPSPDYQFLGVVTRNGSPAALAKHKQSGEYFAITERTVSPLIARKVAAAILAAQTLARGEPPKPSEGDR